MNLLGRFLGLITGASAEWRMLYEAQRIEVAALRDRVDECHAERTLLQQQVASLAAKVEGLNQRLAYLGG